MEVFWEFALKMLVRNLTALHESHKGRHREELALIMLIVREFTIKVFIHFYLLMADASFGRWA
jgi:hypothetical protein